MALLAARPAVQLAAPLAFAPCLRPQVWGGTRLARWLGKTADLTTTYGESWELSPLPGHESRVADGPQQGLSLNELWTQGKSQLCNGRPTHPPAFPWLLKWLDCHQFLSVQVHPNREQALHWLGSPCEKSEAWVVIAAEPTARVYAGFRPGVTPEDVRERLADGTLLECLHQFTPRTGDCIHLPAGTVHAAGGGLVFAEVQQPSDATFRLYDWDRTGPDGAARTLHPEQALACLRWPQPPVMPVSPVVWDAGPRTVVAEQLLTTSFARLDRFTVLQAWDVAVHELTAWMVLAGTAELSWATGQRDAPRGSTLLVPASVREVVWQSVGDCPLQLLRISLPD
jgi:mannose-6-phosphate isomerase